mmetsp:Transcript_74589/g.242231  ORF Transcript_74589/g.242231 Transcript_74589/m.242231 type:complete len:340 (-) Transcript_74589:990-2009(-)
MTTNKTKDDATGVSATVFSEQLKPRRNHPSSTLKRPSTILHNSDGLDVSLFVPLGKSPVSERPEVQSKLIEHQLSHHLFRAYPRTSLALLDQVPHRDEVAGGSTCGVDARVQLPASPLHAEQRQDGPREGGVQVDVVAADEVQAHQTCVGQLQEALVPDDLSRRLEDVGKFPLELLRVLATRGVGAHGEGEPCCLVVVRIEDRCRRAPQHLDLFRRQRYGKAGIQQHQVEARIGWQDRVGDAPKGCWQSPTKPIFRSACTARGSTIRFAHPQQNVPRVEVAMHEVVLEQHAHVDGDALRGDGAAHLLGNAQVPVQGLGPGLRGAAGGGRPGIVRLAEDA